MRGTDRGRRKKKNPARGRIIWVGGGIALLGLSLASREAAAQLAGPSLGVPTVGPGGTGAAGARGGGGSIATGIGGGISGFGNAPGAFTVPFGAYGLPPAPATVPPPLATTPVEIPSVPPAWLLTPSIQFGEAFNDNVNLAPKGSRIADFITTITPGLTLAGQSARVTLNVTYDPQELIFARSSPNTVLQQRLAGTGRAELWRQTLYVEGAASISQAYARSTGAVAPTTLTNNNNLQTVYTETASPYVLQHLGSYADSESRYRFTSTSTSATNGGGGSGIAPEITHELRQTLLGGEFFGRLGWQSLADYTRLERGQATGDPFSGTTGKDELLRTDLKYPVYQALSAIGGIGYERITDPTLVTQPKGVIWDVGLTYQPNQLVAATLTYGERFDRTDIEFNATYNLDPQLSLSAIYTQTIQTGQSLLAASQTPSGAGTTTGTTTTGTTTPGGLTVPGPLGPNPTTGGATGTSPSFGLSSGAFLAKTAEVAATLTKERNTYNATLYETKISGNTVVSTNTSTSAATVTAQRVFGGFFNWGHLLRPDLTANTGAGYYRTLFLDGTGRRDKVYTLSVGLTYNLSRTATATLSLSRSDQRSNITSDTLLDDIIMATIQKQF
jgi:uncharacterized protein (PEP-CTERM system associated)